MLRDIDDADREYSSIENPTMKDRFSKEMGGLLRVDFREARLVIRAIQAPVIPLLIHEEIEKSARTTMINGHIQLRRVAQEMVDARMDAQQADAHVKELELSDKDDERPRDYFNEQNAMWKIVYQYKRGPAFWDMFLTEDKIPNDLSANNTRYLLEQHLKTREREIIQIIRTYPPDHWPRLVEERDPVIRDRIQYAVLRNIPDPGPIQTVSQYRGAVRMEDVPPPRNVGRGSGPATQQTGGPSSQHPPASSSSQTATQPGHRGSSRARGGAGGASREADRRKPGGTSRVASHGASHGTNRGTSHGGV